MTVQFTITIQGSGKSADDCWDDAVSSLSLDPGATPDENEYEIMEDEYEDDDDEEEDEDGDDDEAA